MREAVAPGNGWCAVPLTVDHGTITGGNGTTNVTYTADASGQPVVLHVHVQDWGYCTADNSATIPIRRISAPMIHTNNTDITPTGQAYANIDGPATGTSWNNVTWTIEHGTFPYGNTSQSVTFVADGSGQAVVLHVHVQDYGLCEAQNSITIPIRAGIPGLVISPQTSTVCAGGYGSAAITDLAPRGPLLSPQWPILNRPNHFRQGPAPVTFPAPRTRKR